METDILHLREVIKDRMLEFSDILDNSPVFKEFMDFGEYRLAFEIILFDINEMIENNIFIDPKVLEYTRNLIGKFGPSDLSDGNLYTYFDKSAR